MAVTVSKTDIIAARLGFYASMIAATATTGYGIAQILQVLNLLSKPLDDILIFGFSFCIAPAFLLAMLAVHYIAPADKRIWSHASVLCAVLYAMNALFIYSVQLFTVIPAGGNVDQVLIVGPHSLFWTVDGFAYIFMSCSALFASLVFDSKGLPGRTKYFLLAHGLVLPLFCFAYFYPHFATWVLFIGSPWLITAIGSLLILSLYFRSLLRK
ncbi:MAG: hypothetical protein JSU01_13240 [Bacteroidetes bacterium]|nr:hypothetical protein [Bacteroidota bacterium]